MSQEDCLIINSAQEDTLLQVMPRKPILSSRNAGWTGFYVDYLTQSTWETPEHKSMQHVVVVHTDATSPIYSERRLDGRFQKERIFNGDICVIPADVNHWRYSHVEGGTEDIAIALWLEPALFSHSLNESVNPDTVELLPHFIQSDPLIYQIGLSLKKELETNFSGSRFYAESAATFLAAHLFRHYTSRQYPIRNYAGGLAKDKLRQAIDYIQAHLSKDISLQAIATELGMSPYYFSHLFKKSTGISPYQYLLKCRMERAKQLLLKGDTSIADVALQVGFTSQSQFGKHFKRFTGVTPKQFMKK